MVFSNLFSGEAILPWLDKSMALLSDFEGPESLANTTGMEMLYLVNQFLLPHFVDRRKGERIVC